MLDWKTTANNYKEEAKVMGIIEEEESANRRGGRWQDAEARVARVAGCDWDNEEVRSSRARESLDRASAVAQGRASIRPADTVKLSI